MSEAETLKLFERFKVAAGGDAAAGAMILLAHSQLGRSEAITLAQKAMPQQPLSVKEAATYLRVSPTTVYQLISDGALPHRRIGRQIRIRPADLESYQRETSKAKRQSLAELRKCFD